MSDLPKLLYVDDEESNIETFYYVYRKDFKIITCLSPNEALKIISETKDLAAVISDMRMPEMDGVELIQKAAAINPDIPYFIFTGFEISKEVQEILDKGIIKSYFRKPLNIKEMLSKLKEYV